MFLEEMAIDLREFSVLTSIFFLFSLCNYFIYPPKFRIYVYIQVASVYFTGQKEVSKSDVSKSEKSSGH